MGHAIVDGFGDVISETNRPDVPSVDGTYKEILRARLQTCTGQPGGTDTDQSI